MWCSYSLVALVLVCAIAASSNCQVPLDVTIDWATGEIVAETSKNIWVVFQDASNRVWFGGVLWLGTQEAGAYRFNGKAFEKFRL